MTMDARKQRVLQAIVALYGLEGEPVGSSVLANYFDMAVSSATLRNEMAALTKLGLLTEDRSAKPDASQQKAVAVAAAFLAKQMEE